MSGKRYANPTYLATYWPRLPAENGHLMCPNPSEVPWEVPWEVPCTMGRCFEGVRARVATAGGGGVAAPAPAGSP